MTEDHLTDEQLEHLVEHGWKRTTTGRLWHPTLPPLDGARRRLYTPGEALTLTDAITSTTTCADCGSEECPRAQHPPANEEQHHGTRT